MLTLGYKEEGDKIERELGYIEVCPALQTLGNKEEGKEYSGSRVLERYILHCQHRGTMRKGME